VVVLRLAIPLLHVANIATAEEFYCRRLGFSVEFVHRPEGIAADPCYMGLTRDGVWLHVSSFSGDGVSGGVVNLMVDDVDALHAELIGKAVEIAVGPVDQTWGTREMYVRDADGNTVRFIGG
jgi:catechol 2,3-dioxygenase-like lactoylglutathione lyase family enzyme